MVRGEIAINVANSSQLNCPYKSAGSLIKNTVWNPMALLASNLILTCLSREARIACSPDEVRVEEDWKLTAIQEKHFAFAIPHDQK